jgi:hypothetical protein
MNQTHEQLRGEEASRRREASAVSCPACGATARRAAAHFCATCGRGLRQRTYAPADSLLASYHQQHSRPAMLIEQEMSDVGAERATMRRQFEESLEESRILTTGSALVVIIFSFVPFIGILFCPCAVVMGASNLRRAPDFKGRRRVAVFNIVCGVLIFGVQAFLWWILYHLTK